MNVVDPYPILVVGMDVFHHFWYHAWQELCLAIDVALYQCKNWHVFISIWPVEWLPGIHLELTFLFRAEEDIPMALD